MRFTKSYLNVLNKQFLYTLSIFNLTISLYLLLLYFHIVQESLQPLNDNFTKHKMCNFLFCQKVKSDYISSNLQESKEEGK